MTTTEILHSLGMHATLPRLAILDAIPGIEAAPLSCKMLLPRIINDVGPTSLSTVQANVTAFRAAGLVSYAPMKGVGRTRHYWQTAKLVSMRAPAKDDPLPSKPTLLDSYIKVANEVLAHHEMPIVKYEKEIKFSDQTDVDFTAAERERLAAFDRGVARAVDSRIGNYAVRLQTLIATSIPAGVPHDELPMEYRKLLRNVAGYIEDYGIIPPLDAVREMVGVLSNYFGARVIESMAGEKPLTPGRE